jgi:hypothetical protein
MTEKPPIVRPAALVGDLLWGLLLIRRGESDPAVRLDCEQAADAALIDLEDCGQG